MIKRIFSAFAIVACIATSACSDDKKIDAADVPQAVVQSFTQKYPTATDVKWKTEEHNDKLVYEAEFKYDGNEVEAEFDQNGAFIREE